MKRVLVTLGERSYDVLVDAGGPEGVAVPLVERLGARRVALITDKNVGPLYAERVTNALVAQGCAVRQHTMGVGERAKTVRTCTGIWRWLMAEGFDRRGSVVLALGGGVVGDVAGFVGATWLRGVDVVQVPTTLLAQVDSSVGGKTGFNLDGHKNMVGAFAQPRLVFASLDSLNTLRPRDYRSGLAEVIKHGVLGRPSIVEQIEAESSAVVARSPEVVSELVAACCEVKRDVVVQDEREAGLRQVLNFGHTFGHAIETWTKHRKRHGEAVALGMVSACRVSEALGLCDPTIRERLCAVMRSVGFDVDDAPFWRPEVVDLIRRDKKVRGDSVSFVCVRSMGDVVVAPITFETLDELVRGAPGD